MQKSPYSLAEDGYNDTGLLKRNPLTVRIFDEELKNVDTRFLDMCTTSGVNSATARAIFVKMNSVILSHNISRDNCVGVGVGNASVNIGKHSSIMTRVHSINSDVYFMGCPSHVAHNTANALQMHSGVR